MVRSVQPHDLRAACTACNLTLEDLAEQTGRSVQELLRFSLGELGLNAQERLGILLCLTQHAASHPCTKNAPYRTKRNLKALNVLMREVAQEEALQDLLDHVEEALRTKRPCVLDEVSQQDASHEKGM